MANECLDDECDHRKKHDMIESCQLDCFYNKSAYCKSITNFICSVHGDYNSYAHSSRGCPACIAAGITVEVDMKKGKSISINCHLNWLSKSRMNLKPMRKPENLHKVIGYIRIESLDELYKWQLENQDFIVLTVNPDPHQYPWVFVTYTCNLYK
jgi:hypothetical protein